ncbi:MAG: NUDIX domain-containing protein [Bacteroidales bacterium]|jgi:8-oxo-dGTP pyrophosphatase MutT (NUDIX family)|nr:NUDIX domain-containing protein [Bacteroidales bacterium]NLM91633.1 NUDIX domain-containing protein [Bacteroidales bacterium]
MNTIYLLDKEIRITHLNDSVKGSLEISAEPHQPLPFREHFSRFVTGPAGTRMVLKSSDPLWLLSHVASFFVPREAMGGLVTNQKGQLLFIFRQGKWDLPKGHPDHGETPEETALREVEEECGIDRLSIIAPLPCTFHAFPLKENTWALKKSGWFLMTTTSTKTPTPQIQENITRAEWVDKDKLPGIFTNVFGSVRELVLTAFHEKML